MIHSNTLLHLLYFTSGINFIVLFTASIMLLKKGKYRFQKLFSLTFLLWSVSFANIFFYDYNEFHNINCFYNTLLIIFDFWIMGFMIISLLHFLHYKSSSLNRTLWVLLPFLLFTIAFVTTKSEQVYTLLQYFAGVLSFVMYIYIEFKVRQYSYEIKACYSNLERIHLKWTVYILRICLIIVILWLLLSFNLSPIIDLVYNVLILPLIVYISIKIYTQELPQEINTVDKEEIAQSLPLAFNLDISALIREKQYYLTEDLNLEMLASLIRTNRTYLSRIINSELNTNFYDYINTFRIEHAESLLKDPNCTLSVEQVAYESGFRSYSTFNRFFKKRYNTTPGGFRARKTSSNDLN